MSVARSKRTQTHGPTRDFDLILMDIQMPGMDGLELTRQLTAGPTTRHTVVVAFTAYAMKGDEAKMRAAGCDGHLSKPVDVATFAARVRAYRAQLNRSPFRGVASLPRRDGNRAIATCPIPAPSAGISPLPSAWRSDNPAPCRSRVV